MSEATAPDAWRSVEVVPLSVRAEAANVLRLAAAIVAAVSLYLVGTASTAGERSGTRSLLPFQTLASSLTPVELRMFRELQEGLLEAERVRATQGRWPEPSTLANDGIPPFARDPTDKGPPYIWRLSEAGTIINYLGLTSDPRAPQWLLLAQEPQPDAPPDPTPEDEEHQRLPEGALLHVSIWRHAAGARPGTLIPVPQALGWIQLLGRAEPAAPAGS